MRMVAGSGLFAGLVFSPVVPQLEKGNYLVRDFTRGLCEPLNSTGFEFDVGRYNERRRSMYTSDLFGCSDPWAATGGDQRDIHVGVDIGGPVGTPIHAFADGIVHSCGYNPEHLDYGHVLISEHDLQGVQVWALHGHLSAASVKKTPGSPIRQGEILGWIGDEQENGGWHPHIHFQLSLVRPTTHDLPGVVSTSQHAQALLDYPDPRSMCSTLCMACTSHAFHVAPLVIRATRAYASQPDCMPQLQHYARKKRQGLECKITPRSQAFWVRCMKGAACSSNVDWVISAAWW